MSTELEIRIAKLQEALNALKEAAQSTCTIRTIRTIKIDDLEWQADVPDEKFTWAQAKAYAASLGAGWRLPTIKELLTLVDYEKHDPACSIFSDCPSEWFWSSSALSGDTSVAWFVSFYYGASSHNGVGNTHRVRCVR